MGRHVGAHPDGHQHGGRIPTETSVTEFYYKSVNLSLEELKNIKRILFLIQEPVRKTKNPFGTKIRLNISFQLLLYLIKVKYQQDQPFCSLNFSDVM